MNIKKEVLGLLEDDGQLEMYVKKGKKHFFVVDSHNLELHSIQRLRDEMPDGALFDCHIGIDTTIIVAQF